jgi:hypothetical protein
LIRLSAASYEQHSGRNIFSWERAEEEEAQWWVNIEGVNSTVDKKYQPMSDPNRGYLSEKEILFSGDQDGELDWISLMQTLVKVPSNRKHEKKSPLEMLNHLTNRGNVMLPISIGLRMCLHIWMNILKYLAATPNGLAYFSKDIEFTYYILFLMEDCNFDTFGVPQYMADATESMSVGENAALIFIMIMQGN